MTDYSETEVGAIRTVFATYRNLLLPLAHFLYETLAIDILGPLLASPVRNKYRLVVGEYFIRWMEAYPIPNQVYSLMIGTKLTINSAL